MDLYKLNIILQKQSNIHAFVIEVLNIFIQKQAVLLQIDSYKNTSKTCCLMMYCILSTRYARDFVKMLRNIPAIQQLHLNRSLV